VIVLCIIFTTQVDKQNAPYFHGSGGPLTWSTQVFSFLVPEAGLDQVSLLSRKFIFVHNDNCDIPYLLTIDEKQISNRHELLSKMRVYVLNCLYNTHNILNRFC